ncbi:MAG: prepilin-type N-terminal cleavage/methylation domain-containing protein [Candidatus Methylomirabilia bacterium]
MMRLPILWLRGFPFWRRHGFTLIEIVIGLAVVAILAALITPLAFQAFQSSNEEATRTEIEEIFRAIVGNPERGKFGYLGDMGRLPTTLSELLVQGNQPAFHTADGTNEHVGGVGTGWRGPYLLGQFDPNELFVDAWGRPYSYTADPTQGQTNQAGQIISAGPDGALGTGDDIEFPVRPPGLANSQSPVQVTSTLIVTVIVNDIPQPNGLTVEIFSAQDGEQVLNDTKETATDGNAPFRFTIPGGVDVVSATHTSGATTVTRVVTIPVVPGTQVSRQIILKTSARVAM